MCSRCVLHFKIQIKKKARKIQSFNSKLEKVSKVTILKFVQLKNSSFKVVKIQLSAISSVQNMSILKINIFKSDIYCSFEKIEQFQFKMLKILNQRRTSQYFYSEKK